MEPALVHDYLLVMRGAERTFAALTDYWGSAPIYTTVYSEPGTGKRFAGRQIHSSFLQRLPVSQRNFRRFLPLYPPAVERLDVSAHRVVVSSSSAFAHGIRPAPGAVHLCYCHSPFRYAWHERELALGEVPRPLRPVLAGVLAGIRTWDRRASGRVTRYLANSELVRQRIGDYYGRDARVVHPPVDTERFSIGSPEDYLLVVGEVAYHKRSEIALEAARRAGRPIKVVGTGPALEGLRARFREDAQFLGRVPDNELPGLYARALALVVPNVEEFGIAAVEAQAAGRPVLAVDAGGTRETVVDGVTGVLVPNGDVDQMAEAMREVDFRSFSPELIRQHAQRFGRERFQREVAEEVERLAG